MLVGQLANPILELVLGPFEFVAEQNTFVELTASCAEAHVWSNGTTHSVSRNSRSVLLVGSALCNGHLQERSSTAKFEKTLTCGAWLRPRLRWWGSTC